MSDHPNRSELRIADDVLWAGAIALLLDEAVERTVTTHAVDPVEHVKAEGRAEGISEALGILLWRDAAELRADSLAGILERRCRAQDAIADARQRLRSDQ